MAQILSMTGFGQAEGSCEQGAFTATVKSVNHRFLECRIHLPSELASLEIPLTRRIKQRLNRGKVDASLRWSPAPEQMPRVAFNKPLLESYANEVRQLAEDLRLPGCASLEFLLGLPGGSEVRQPELDENEVLALAERVLDQALDRLVAERERDGRELAADLNALIGSLEKAREHIAERREDVLAEQRERLLRKAEEWAQSASVQLEPGRLEAEVMLFAERSDIAEELSRLGAHLEAFRELLGQTDGKPKGKPLEFLTQEVLRETNTIASKCKDTGISQEMLAMKADIEKIREQVSNAE